MIAVAIKELKNRLSAYLRDVARGEVILVTDRGRVVAELRQPGAGRASGPPGIQALARLEDMGLLTLGLPQDKAAYRKAPRQVKSDSQSLLDAERGDR